MMHGIDFFFFGNGGISVSQSAFSFPNTGFSNKIRIVLIARSSIERPLAVFIINFEQNPKKNYYKIP